MGTQQRAIHPIGRKSGTRVFRGLPLSGSISGLEPRTTWSVGERCTAGVREATATLIGHDSFSILSEMAANQFASAKFGMVIIFQRKASPLFCWKLRVLIISSMDR